MLLGQLLDMLIVGLDDTVPIDTGSSIFGDDAFLPLLESQELFLKIKLGGRLSATAESLPMRIFSYITVDCDCYSE